MSKIEDKLSALCADLVYISESDMPIDVWDWSDVSEKDIPAKISETSADEQREQVNAQEFFKETLDTLDSNDEALMALKKDFEKLFDYLDATFKDIHVYRSGDGEVHIFIICRLEDQCFALHTISTET